MNTEGPQRIVCLTEEPTEILYLLGEQHRIVGISVYTVRPEEAKENLKINAENQTLASITYQNFFKLYKKIAGCTGTALTESEEFFEI